METESSYLQSQNPRAPAGPSCHPDWQRLWRLLAIWGAIVAAIFGAAVTLQVGVGLYKFGGSQYLPRVVALSIVREGGAGTTASAAVLALVNWSHHHRPTELRRFWRPAFLRGLLGVAIVFPIATTLALASSFGVGLSVYGIDWTTFSSGAARTVSSSDLAVGFAEAVVSGLVLVPLASFLLPTIARLAWNLPLKLAATWSGLFAIGVLSRAVLSRIP